MLGVFEDMEKRVAQEVRMKTRGDIIERAKRGDFTWDQAALALGITARQLRRVRERYEAEGRPGLRDGRQGRPRKKQIAEETGAEMCQLKKEEYAEFSVRHFYDFAVERHGLKASYSWLLRTLQGAKVVDKTRRRGTYRRKRARQPMVGMRVHTDGSTHAWLGPHLPVWDLVLMLDDADGQILSAWFVPEEGVLSTLQLLQGEVIKKKGCFGELYHDRGSAYCRTSDKQQGPDEEQKGQIPRVLKTLGIRQIWAYSPQARGRCERAFGTIQGRLPQELKKAGITDYDQANCYLQDIFIPQFNRKFTVVPKETGSAFVRLGRRDLKLVLSVQYTRILNNDYTVHFDRRSLQLPKPPCGQGPFPQSRVTVHRFMDGTLGVSSHGKLLCTFDDEEPTGLPPEKRIFSPRPSAPEPTPRRGGTVVSETEFFAFLNERAEGPLAQGDDLFPPDWETCC